MDLGIEIIIATTAWKGKTLHCIPLRRRRENSLPRSGHFSYQRHGRFSSPVVSRHSQTVSSFHRILFFYPSGAPRAFVPFDGREKSPLLFFASTLIPSARYMIKKCPANNFRLVYLYESGVDRGLHWPLLYMNSKGNGKRSDLCLQTAPWTYFSRRATNTRKKYQHWQVFLFSFPPNWKINTQHVKIYYFISFLPFFLQ